MQVTTCSVVALMSGVAVGRPWWVSMWRETPFTHTHTPSQAAGELQD